MDKHGGSGADSLRRVAQRTDIPGSQPKSWLRELGDGELGDGELGELGDGTWGQTEELGDGTWGQTGRFLSLGGWRRELTFPALSQNRSSEERWGAAHFDLQGCGF